MTTKPWKPRKNSPEWEEFKRYLETELLSCYQQLANLETSPTKTDQVRGKAAFITKLLCLDKAHDTTAATED